MACGDGILLLNLSDFNNQWNKDALRFSRAICEAKNKPLDSLSTLPRSVYVISGRLSDYLRAQTEERLENVREMAGKSVFEVDHDTNNFSDFYYSRKLGIIAGSKLEHDLKYAAVSALKPLYKVIHLLLS